MAAILVVDDEPSARLTMALLLARRGHRVREAGGVREAVEVFAGDAFDLVLTDLRMPDGLGLDVLQAAKRQRTDPDVILLTAYAGWESAKEAMRLGALDYFEKGHEPDGLFHRIDAALAARARRRAETEGERRVLTVLFADLRGSMELLAARDLDEARGILDGVVERMMDAVHRHGGTVNQVMGDGIMALFGAPAELEDHALRGCRAALLMHEEVARFAADLRRAREVDVQIRVGLNSGEVILRAIGSDVGRDYSAVGQPTHVASRMEHLARPGTTLITAETWALAGDRVLVRPIGSVAVKGLPDRIVAHELVGLAPATAMALPDRAPVTVGQAAAIPGGDGTGVSAA